MDAVHAAGSVIVGGALALVAWSVIRLVVEMVKERMR